MKYLKLFEDYSRLTYSDIAFIEELYEDGMTDPNDIVREMDFIDHITVDDVERVIRNISRNVNESTSGSVDNKSSQSYKSLKKKSEDSGISLTILKQVYKRGMAAWNSGHRPGTPQNAWAMGRVNSFITGSGGARKADSDLWSKAKTQKEKKKK
jgi:hypothetical protein